MFEVNAVLTNKFDAANYVPASSNINTNSADDTASSSDIDSRRYTQFDRTITNAGSTTMSFDDMVDMVNPLQHIPVVSSLYRSIEGESINPVSRIVGDMMYSAPLGLASAGISGINAIANSALESSTGGDGTSHVLAALFGTDNSDSQLANNIAPAQAATPTPLIAASSIPVTSAPLDVLAATTAPKTVMPSPKATQVASTSVSAPSSQVANTSSVIASNSKFFPLDRSHVNMKNPTMDTNDVENQNRIISLAESSHTMRLGHTIYTSPLMNGPKPMPIASIPPVNTQTPAVAVNTASTTDTSPTDLPSPAANLIPSPLANSTTSTIGQTSVLSSANSTPIPPGLFDDAMILKRLNQYKNFASTPVPSGSTLDTSN